MSDGSKKVLGRILLDQRAVRPEDLERVLARRSADPLASRLCEEGLLSELEALKALSNQRGIPGVDLQQICIKLSDLSAIPRDIALLHRLLPVLERSDRIFVAMANPEDRKVLEELEFVTGKRVIAYIALESALRAAIRAAYDARDRGELYHVGPRCPKEVLEKAGLDPAAYLRSTPPARASAAEVVAAPDDKRSERALRPAPAGEPKRSLASETTQQFATRQEASLVPSNRDVRPVVVDDRMRSSPPLPVSEAGEGLEREVSEVGKLPEERADADQKKVLVVDDDLEIRRMVKRVLEGRGLTVIEADRGTSALHLIKLANPDLVVLDAMLPEVNGFEIAKRIRGSARYGHIPVIMVSAVYRGDKFKEDAKVAYGINDYLEKPFSLQTLTELVISRLEATSGSTQKERSAIGARAEALLNEGITAYRAGRIEEATEKLQRGVASDPLAYRLRYHLGLLLAKQNQVHEAIVHLELAVQTESKHFPSLKNLAILYQTAGFRKKAVDVWTSALPLAPTEEIRAAIRTHLESMT